LKFRKGNSNPTWSGHGEISGRFWTAIKAHAVSRNIPFDISIEQAWLKFQQQEGRCALTGWPLTLNTRKGQTAAKTASLDRICSSENYTNENTQWVHKDVNRSKWDHSTERFLQICEAVVAHRATEKPK
jgi:hypothetical protein